MSLIPNSHPQVPNSHTHVPNSHPYVPNSHPHALNSYPHVPNSRSHVPNSLPFPPTCPLLPPFPTHMSLTPSLSHPHVPYSLPFPPTCPLLPPFPTGESPAAMQRGRDGHKQLDGSVGDSSDDSPSGAPSSPTAPPPLSTLLPASLLYFLQHFLNFNKHTGHPHTILAGVAIVTLSYLCIVISPLSKHYYTVQNSLVDLD